MRLVAHGTPPWLHAAMDNAIMHLGALCGRSAVAAADEPDDVTALTSKSLLRWPAEDASATRTSSIPLKPSRSGLLSKEQYQVNSMLRTSISPTSLRRIQVQRDSSEAEVTLDIRAIPAKIWTSSRHDGEGDRRPQITIEAGNFRALRHAITTGTEMYKMLETVQQKLFPAPQPCRIW